MRFLIDAQLPVGLCRWLEAKGHSALHVGEVIPGNADDPVIARYAAQAELIIVSKDEDFSRLQSRNGHRLLWLRCGNLRNARLYLWLELRWAVVEQAFEAGDSFLELY